MASHLFEGVYQRKLWIFEQSTMLWLDAHELTALLSWQWGSFVTQATFVAPGGLAAFGELLSLCIGCKAFCSWLLIHFCGSFTLCTVQLHKAAHQTLPMTLVDNAPDATPCVDNAPS